MYKNEQYGAPPGKRLETLQALRAIAALIVVIHHAVNLLDYRSEISTGVIRSWPGLNSFGAVGVDIFFVISGFAMAEAMSGKSKCSAGRFLAERFIRVMPMFWIMSLFTACLLVSVGFKFSAAQVANSITMLPLWEPDQFIHPVLGVGWTLMFEWAFYLVVTLSILASPNRPAQFALLMAVLFGAAGLFFHHLPAIQMMWVNAIWLEFAGGIALQLSWRNGFFNRYLKIGPILLWCSIFWFGLTIWNDIPFSVLPEDLFRGQDNLRFWCWGVPSIMFVGGAIAVGERALSRGRKLPFWNGWLRLGDASYSLYLLHLGPFIFLAETLPVFHWRGEWLVAIMTVVSIAIALAIYDWVEKPLLQRSRHLAFQECFRAFDGCPAQQRDG